LALSATRALDALDVESLAVVIPHASALDELGREYLDESGFDVVSVDGCGLVDNTEIGALTASDAETVVREAVPDDHAVDGVVVPCPNYRPVAVPRPLEAGPTGRSDASMRASAPGRR
jgi:maleate isomerase